MKVKNTVALLGLCIITIISGCDKASEEAMYKQDNKSDNVISTDNQGVEDNEQSDHQDRDSNIIAVQEALIEDEAVNHELEDEVISEEAEATQETLEALLQIITETEAVVETVDEADYSIIED